ncbi:MAG: sigma-E processing peptidase SpoIIGA, partial [Lachnospiraceae bacterium]|nr:sigma-E processing peptidase SpoIIGA [Lachnospiraceae bacterium]
ITVNGKRFCCNALVDTGNSLCDPISRRPVLILERSVLKAYEVTIRPEQYRVIPYHSLGRENGMLEGFVAGLVCVLDETENGRIQRMKRSNVVIGIYEGTLSGDGAYQMILHPMFM